jgi:putative transcriptional regulator
MDHADSLEGRLLIAMPSLMDPNFHHSVALIIEQGSHGAIGLVINRPLELEVGEVLSQFVPGATGGIIANQPVLLGGPVELERGFVLHEPTGEWQSTKPVGDDLCVTASADILHSLAGGDGPEPALIMVGYAGWGAGQLEAEIGDNSWLVAPAPAKLIFDTPYEDRWEAATRLLGIEPASIASDAGHA